MNWWAGQLTGLLPARLLNAYVQAGDAAILEISGDRFLLQAKRGARLEPAGEGRLDELAQALHTAPDLPRLRLLRIAEAQALRKMLVLPYAVRHDLKTVLSSEIDRETPFEQSEVYWSHSVIGHDSAKTKLEVELVLLPRRAGEAIAATARQAGFEPDALAIGDGKTSLLWMDGHYRAPLPRIQPKNKKLMRAVYALGAAIVLVPLAVQQVHFILADRTIAEMETKALAASALQKAANRRVAAMEFMGHKNGANGSALKILQAVTRVLPDDTFLTGLSIHGGQITMAGSSEVAANLIKAVSNASQFRDPVFESAVTENPDTELENFTISTKLVDAS